MAEAIPVVGGAQQRTAFVLAGGGSLGAVEVGMLQALLEWGEAPAFLVGASAGAINAAYFAGDPSRAGARELERIWCALKRREVFPFNLGSVFGLLRRRDHLVDSSGLRRLLERHLPYRQLEDAALPVHLVASDMLSGREALLSAGPVVDAVLASAAIPGVYPPVWIDGRWLVDGGVANNTPISVAVGLGATRVIVLPTGFACALERAPSGAIARAMHALSLLVARQLVYDADHFAGSAVELRIVPSLCPLGVSPYDYSAAAGLIARARTQTSRWLERGGLERAGTPPQLREHHD
ncbi:MULTISPECIES: patatin-like phospholipase family protein [Rhodanobacter]|uniref:patatin-like phospholipase family protein n=1 Tax=Rhodanobacter TaxID=75309 RepID=UPI00040C349C|nr:MULTISPECIES: patatin-like phospholipase family protein [Rhodanobacter]UJJ58201.1 patatin-like phospholipase family protein [Rhodanobacter denitrificans]